jgi:phage tail-like protein
MSCGPADATFRLLDCFVGWDEASALGLGGLDDPRGVCLLAAHPDALGEAEIDARIPPRYLAHGCGGCEWLLATGSALLVRDGCGAAWRPARATPVAPPQPWQPSAVATWGDLIAVVESAGRVWLLSIARGRSPIALAVEGPAAVALGAAGLTVAAAAGLLRFDPSGAPVDRLALPDGVAPSSIDRLAVAPAGELWLAVRDGELRRVFRYGTEGQPRAASRDELAAALPATGVRTSDDGFCIAEPGPRGAIVTSCFGLNGAPRAAGVAADDGPERLASGVLVTRALDSGVPRCRWHRVRIDADVPPGTSLLVEVATAEDELAAPHDADWTTAGPGSADFLIAQPPGRFLYMRMTLRGDGRATPRVRRVRLDLPRATSLDRLPGVYREDPEAAEFTERFLALFDAQIEELDRAIERFPAMLDPGGVPDDVLPWLASLVGVAFDPAWEAERRRALLAAAPELHRRRGTVGGLVRAIQLVLGVEPVVEELAAARAYSTIGAARIGQVRLYGRNRARFRVGRSPLGRAPVRSYGNPDDDVVREAAYRLRVRVPPVPGATRAQADARLRRLVEAQKPAHIAVEATVGGGGGTLGGGLLVGVDTVFAPPPPPVLGRAGNIRLHRASVLWHARREL